MYRLATSFGLASALPPPQGLSAAPFLSDFYYKDSTGWTLTNLSLGTQNLVVGMNAVGKSRTVHAIGNVASFIRGAGPSSLDNFECSLFWRNGNSLEYSFEVFNGEIRSEILRVKGETLIQRELFSAKMYGDRINPPSGKLIIQTRRDTKRYPEIEEIIGWAEHTSLFIFSNITTSPKSLSPYAISREPLLPEMFSKLSDSQKNQLKKLMSDLGYPIANIIESERENGAKTLLIYENGVPVPLSPFDLSNGMFRVFCILNYMLYFSTLSQARCLIIDDVGEGLDYRRSSELGQILFDYCKSNNIQLIVTSNDSFLLDTISLDYWNILTRKGNIVDSRNNKNSKELFEEFARTGLSNFDILSSNFLSNNE